MSIVDACGELIQETPAKGPISYDVAVREIRERTGLADLERDDLMAPMIEATDRLHREGVPGVKNIARSGWQRMDAGTDMYEYVVRRQAKARRQVERGVTAIEATDRSLLGWDERNRLDTISNSLRRVAELVQRRQRRRRPLPPAD
jgi:hypothetical protein